MTNARDIKTKIASVKNTQKITYAMQMVSASKMRKAQERMSASRPYATKMLQVIDHIAAIHPEHKHPYFKPRAVKRVGFIIMTTDRGLCGALNLNIFKKAVLMLNELKNQHITVDLCLFGNKADNFFSRYLNCNIVAKGLHITDETAVGDLIGAVKVMLDAYHQGNIDELYLCYSKFVTTMKQDAVIQKLLPIVSTSTANRYWDYIYEPDDKKLLDALLNRYLESQVYQGAVESYASEQAARMVAMMGASDNAENLIDELQLIYNKARQAGVTREISEIVAGANALKEE